MLHLIGVLQSIPARAAISSKSIIGRRIKTFIGRPSFPRCNNLLLFEASALHE